MDLIYAVSRLTAVKEEWIILEEEKPLVLHLEGEESCHDQVAFLSRVSTIQWDGGKSFWQWKYLPVRSFDAFDVGHSDDL